MEAASAAAPITDTVVLGRRIHFSKMEVELFKERVKASEKPDQGIIGNSSSAKRLIEKRGVWR